MSSLQSRKSGGKTYYQKQFTPPNARRTTLRLGALSQKAATEISRHIDHLIKAHRHATRIEEETEAWLRSADSVLVARLAKYGLCQAYSDPTLTEFVAAFIQNKKPESAARTIVQFEQVQRLLDEFMPAGIRLAGVTPQQAKEFFHWLRTVKNNNPNTARRRFGRVREIYNDALEQNIVTRNPFKLKSIKVSVGVGAKEYVATETIGVLIEYCPTNEWRLLFALARWIGLRIPSEIQNLKLTDVNRENNTIRIESPKTKHCGKGERVVPIVEEISEYLDRQFFESEIGEVFMFPNLRCHTNLATTAASIVTKAGVPAWPRFWTSLRASCETDMMDRYGIRKACQWLGNTVVIAMRNYAQVRKSDYLDAGDMSLTKSDAKSDAAPARFAENGGERNQTNAANPTFCGAAVAEAGLEPARGEPPTGF